MLKYDLDELVAGITEENRHGETDWGPEVGREVSAHHGECDVET
jgi:antitoxin component of MazEF toxin-antitoxin module